MNAGDAQPQQETPTRRFGVRGRPRVLPTERESSMMALFKKGKTFQDIGAIYGLTRERVRQIFKKYFNETGKTNTVRYNVVTLKKVEALKERLAESKEKETDRYARIFGCTKDVVTSINGKEDRRMDRHTPASQYYDHKRNAIRRGISWKLSFPEWWQIWQESGKYGLRGGGKKYGMSRYGDSGAYELGNIYICTGAQNASDQYLVRPRQTHCRRGGHPYATGKTKHYCPICAKENLRRKTDNALTIIAMCLPELQKAITTLNHQGLKK